MLYGSSHIGQEDIPISLNGEHFFEVLQKRGGVPRSASRCDRDIGINIAASIPVDYFSRRKLRLEACTINLRVPNRLALGKGLPGIARVSGVDSVEGENIAPIGSLKLLLLE
jgi:hypothetical protein